MSKIKVDLDTTRELHRAGNLLNAKKNYLAILRHDPKSVEALHSLGILSAQQENYSDAIEYLKKAIQYQPNHFILYLHLANILKLQGLFSQAAETLHHLIDIKPDYAAALNNLGTVYYALGKLTDAVYFFQEAIKKQSSYVDAYYNLGLALVKQNKFDEAISTYETVLKFAPEHFAAQFHLACILMHQEKIPDALKKFLHIETAHPFHVETQTNLATCYLKQGLLNDAKQHYLKALELTPVDTQILFNLGVINTEQNYLDHAIQYYQRAIKINPDDIATHNNLGVAFIAKQHLGFALHHFQEVQRLQPDNQAIRHTLDILSQNQRLLASPPDYIRALFDSYADHYEAHLLQALEYKVPDLLFAAVSKTLKFSPNKSAILDLGCGTGLCGMLFKPLAKKLEGVDLSEKMLALAAQKNIYDVLTAQDLTIFLRDKKSCYNLIVAADVLVYLGDLDALFTEIYQGLRDDGLFAFNTEISEEADYRMNQSGRFSHQKKYIESLAKKNKLTIVFYENKITRMQNNDPVYGHLYILQRELL